MRICSVCDRCFEDSVGQCVVAGHPPLADSRKGDPSMVPGYLLEEIIAATAKLDTYRAQRLDCGRSCLIRLVSADAQNCDEFTRDAGLAAMVFDARVADIYESGSLSNGDRYVVEEDLGGRKTLRRHLDEQGVPDLLTSIRIVEQLAESLHVLHLNGLPHGAVRPSNIILDFATDGLPAVTLCGIDLGGVVARNTIANKFLIDSAIDSIRYFAPEQCAGQATTPQTDVYSLGVVFYELLAGVAPFDAPKATALIELHRNHRPPEIAVADFELRMLVTHSLSESLQKQPSFRQSSADLFARQMRHIEQLATHVSTPPPAVGAQPPAIRIATPPPAHITVPPNAPSHDAGIIEEKAEFVGEFFESIDSPTPGPIRRAAESTEVVCAAQSQELAPSESRSLPGTVQPPLDLKREDGDDAPGQPNISIDFPLPERPSLAERRHRLRLRMKELHPPQPNRVDTREEVAQVGSSDMVEGPEPAAIVTPSDPMPSENIHLEAAAKPQLIEWEQPDDIPPLDEIDRVGPVEFDPAPYASSPASSTREVLPAAPANAQPHLIAWDQPEDDIPSIEEVIEARINAEKTVARAIQFNPEDFKVAEAMRERIDADSKVHATRPIVIAHNEVTVAETNKFDFVPTLLGEKDRRPAAEPTTDHTSIFSSYEPAGSRSRRFPYRSMFIGVGLMTLAALLGLGGDPVWRYFSSNAPDVPVATAAVPESRAPIPARADRSTDEELPSFEVEPPSTFRQSEAVTETPEHVSSKRAAAAVPKARRPVQNNSPVSPSPVREGAPPFAPSTVVITYGSGNIRRTDSTRAGKQAPADKPVGAGATRPRIVQVPRDR